MKAKLIALALDLTRIFGRRDDSAKNIKRALVHEILSIQVLSAALVGALAIGGLYLGGQWILHDNYSRWALQWTEQLNAIGAPFYLVDDEEAHISLEDFVARYPEISQVIFFSKHGEVLHSVDGPNENDPIETLAPDELQEAVAVVGTQKPYLMHGGFLNPQQFEITAPVWIESIPDDGLFGFDASTADLLSKTELLGFVRMKLDFVLFHDRLLSSIRSAALILLVLLVAFSFYGRYILRRSLASISDLQLPIQELAKGNLKVKFEPAQHREISDIVEALEITVSALSERDEQLRELANHDSLTGLFNRRRFVEELMAEGTDVTRKDESNALFFIDLDQFKYINDACGHPAGDRLIRNVADELRRSVGPNDVVARFGGDEFVILVRTVDSDAAQAVAETILTNMRRMAHIEDERIFHVHCSIGITMMAGANQHHDELINQADIACREAKSAGRNRMRTYSRLENRERRGYTDISWMNGLREALDEDKFELRFQPINNIMSGETTHHELLIRLRTADGKLVSPDAFLPSAVRFGLMNEIDFWMIRHAAIAYAEHSRPVANLKFSINLSANAFENDDLTGYVEEMFRQFEVPLTDVVFEITESLAVRRPVQVDRQVAALRDLGCKFALDDFGTGYSSFAYLQRLQFDYIKIDGTFVHDLPSNPVDQKMIKLIAEVGREAGMQTIAEYVRNVETLEILADLGVDMAQGYFVGRPTRIPMAKSTPISLDSRRQRWSRKKSPSN
ncbi:MAG: EAL domain-containing protein [Woeseiaceae bacterium]|nr:EAL domain-containing protein [Woeseiaceae bacterium]